MAEHTPTPLLEKANDLLVQLLGIPGPGRALREWSERAEFLLMCFASHDAAQAVTENPHA